VLEAIVGMLNLVSTWRFFVVLVAVVGAFFAFAENVAAGLPRVFALAASVVVGVGLGRVWQRRHDRAKGNNE